MPSTSSQPLTSLFAAQTRLSIHTFVFSHFPLSLTSAQAARMYLGWGVLGMCKGERMKDEHERRADKGRSVERKTSKGWAERNGGCHYQAICFESHSPFPNHQCTFIVPQHAKRLFPALAPRTPEPEALYDIPARLSFCLCGGESDENNLELEPLNLDPEDNISGTWQADTRQKALSPLSAAIKIGVVGSCLKGESWPAEDIVLVSRQSCRARWSCNWECITAWEGAAIR